MPFFRCHKFCRFENNKPKLKRALEATTKFCCISNENGHLTEICVGSKRHYKFAIYFVYSSSCSQQHIFSIFRELCKQLQSILLIKISYKNNIELYVITTFFSQISAKYFVIMPTDCKLT